MLRRVLLIACLLQGCTTLPAERPRWGAASTWAPSGARLKAAASQALTHPWTWVPLAGAAAITVLDVDHDIARWARRETPVFGSNERALSRGSQWKKVLHDASIITLLAADSGDEPRAWWSRKVQGFIVHQAGSHLRGLLSDGVKVGTGRERPDASDERSFPSGHTSGAFYYAAWNNANLDYVDIPDDLRVPLEYANMLGAAGVGWARVEAGRHYPTDVMVGAALGNFTAHFVQRAFVGIPEPGEPELLLQLAPDGFVVGLRWSF